MARLFELIYTGAIVVCAIIASGNDKQPYRVPMCLTGSGPNGEDMDTNVWSDFVEKYKERYPGSYCGKCGAERPCPTREKK